MSSGMYWRPHPKAPEATTITDAKWVLAPRYWGHDGSLHGEPVVFTAADLPYLDGVHDGSGGNQEQREAIGELIDAIREHSAVDVWIGEPDDAG